VALVSALPRRRRAARSLWQRSDGDLTDRQAGVHVMPSPGVGRERTTLTSRSHSTWSTCGSRGDRVGTAAGERAPSRPSTRCRSAVAVTGEAMSSGPAPDCNHLKESLTAEEFREALEARLGTAVVLPSCSCDR
jgi:hypothetical protein